MRLAIVDNKRSAPSPGLTGSCPVCGRPVIAKCGNQRVHHWAHRGERVCDQWWEPETEWHRNWKHNFPEDWQEIVLHDRGGEKHIADVRTAQGLTIEFQHSHLRPEERAAREDFYGKMIWVIDGLRLGRDLPRFKEGMRGLRQAGTRGVYIHHSPEELFSKNWLTSKAPVFFDFGSTSLATASPTPIEHSLWCLLPGRVGAAIVLSIRREEFVRLAHETPNLLPWQSILIKVEQWLAGERQRQAQEHLYFLASLRHRPRWAKPSGKRFRKRRIF